MVYSTKFNPKPVDETPADQQAQDDYAATVAARAQKKAVAKQAADLAHKQSVQFGGSRLETLDAMEQAEQQGKVDIHRQGAEALAAGQSAGGMGGGSAYGALLQAGQQAGQQAASFGAQAAKDRSAFGQQSLLQQQGLEGDALAQQMDYLDILGRVGTETENQQADYAKAYNHVTTTLADQFRGTFNDDESALAAAIEAYADEQASEYVRKKLYALAAQVAAGEVDLMQ